jgi:hypothetical protein
VAEVANARPTKADIRAVKKGNPFKTGFVHLSAQTLGTLALLRNKVEAGGNFPTPAKSQSLPIDPRDVAEADGILVVPSSAFGPEFECLIEYNAKTGRFVLFHKVDAAGNLPPKTRLAIARHVGHYSREEDELKTGGVRDTTRLDAGTDEREKAADIAASILVPDEMLAKDLEVLAQKYKVSSALIRYQAQCGASATPPSDVNPRKPGAITP